MSVPTSTRKRGDVLVVEDCKVIVQQSKAVLVWCAAAAEATGEATMWIPHSQIDDDSEVYESSDPGEVGDLVITLWIAEQRGLL